jgi:hypothetical protein
MSILRTTARCAGACDLTRSRPYSCSRFCAIIRITVSSKRLRRGRVGIAPPQRGKPTGCKASWFEDVPNVAPEPLDRAGMRFLDGINRIDGIEGSKLCLIPSILLIPSKERPPRRSGRSRPLSRPSVPRRHAWGTKVVPRKSASFVLWDEGGFLLPDSCSCSCS